MSALASRVLVGFHKKSESSVSRCGPHLLGDTIPTSMQQKLLDERGFLYRARLPIYMGYFVVWGLRSLQTYSLKRLPASRVSRLFFGDSVGEDTSNSVGKCDCSGGCWRRCRLCAYRAGKAGAVFAGLFYPAWSYVPRGGIIVSYP